MNKTASDLLIGDLLRGAGLVSLPDLTNAVQVASKTGLPVGRVLVMLGLITPEVVQAALDTQSLVRDRAIPMDAGIRIIKVIAVSRVSLDDALRQLGLLQPEAPSNKLGDLLLTAELITQEQLADALNMSQHLGLPLGRIFVLKGYLSEEQVESALEVQILLRDQKISRLQALEALRTMRLCGSSLEEALDRLGCLQNAQRKTVRLGELIMLADLVSDTDLQTALEIGLIEDIKIGQVLIEFGFINDYILEASLRLQGIVQNNHMSVGQAVEALRMVAYNNVGLLQAVATVIEPMVPEGEVVSLLQLLRLSGLVTQEEFERLTMFVDTSIFNVVLAGTGVMSETTLEVAIRCHSLLKEGFLTCEQAIVALHHWWWTGVDLPEILKNMGWSNGEKPKVAPLILTWQSETPQFDEPQVSIDHPVDPARTLELEMQVTNSVANHEWKTPQADPTWNNWH